ncbi:MAG: Rieske 2Fe-2S domain-containing protein [Euzebyales bacterium]|jgi:ubiquinol-cytochrome c reductase iron-sulfur subunit|nr:Rieske 2Fe-2S domain-containing protein [Euzebyales bacterium]
MTDGTAPGSRQPETTPVADEIGDLRVIARDDPPPSGANDLIVMGAASGAILGGIGFAVGLLAGAPLGFYGAALAVGLLSLGVAVRRWITDRFPDIDAVELRPGPEPSGPIADVAPVPRRSFLGRFLAVAAGVLGLGLIAPVVSLGPAPGDALRRTAWRRGSRLVTTDGQPLSPADLSPGGVVTVWPEGAIGDETAAVILLRLSGEPVDPTNGDWVVDSTVVAYSKICTHAGCPVGLFREQDDALFCPCHQSTFDAQRGAIPTFGPTARALPQLPLGVDDEGNLVALGDFTEQVGPAFG